MAKKKIINNDQLEIAIKKQKNQIFNPCAFFFFLLPGAPLYYHAIYIVLTYLASFTGYEDDIVYASEHLLYFKCHRKCYIESATENTNSFVLVALANRYSVVVQESFKKLSYDKKENG